MLYTILLLCLFLSYLGYAISNGRADAIRDYRVHIAKHPFRDFYHIMLWITKLSLIGIGVFNTLLFSYFKIWFIIVYNIIFISMSIVIWNYNYNDPEHKWYKKDESLKISTGIKWIDHLIGLHH